MKIVNCKVAHIRPKYNDLAEWVADPKNEYIGRRGVVFVRGERFPKKDSIFHNPFKISKGVGRAEVVAHFEQYLRARLASEPDLKEKLLALSGKTLGCWCAPEACHGDILIKIIKELENAESKSGVKL